MKRAVILIGLLLILTVTAVTITATPTTPLPTSANAYLTAYQLPQADGAPLHIVAESPTKAWFTLPGNDAIGSLVITSTVDFEFSYYDVPAGSEPYDLALAGNHIWFTLRTANQIGRLNKLSGVIDYYTVPTSNSAPTGIAVAANGLVWFAQENGNRLAALNPATGTFEEFLYGRAGACLHDVAVYSNNLIIAAAPCVQRIVELYLDDDLDDGYEFFELSTAATSSQARYLTLHNNVLFISAQNSNLIGRNVPGTLSLWRWYAPPSPSSGLAAINVGSYDGVDRIWVAQRNINRVLMIEIAAGGVPTFYWQQPLPSGDSQPTGLSLLPSGTLWLTAPGSNEILVWSPPYVDFERAYLPILSR